MNHDDTIKIKPRRVYKCESEKRMFERKQVWKDESGNYHCPVCGETVKDVTDTTTGHDFMELVLL